MPLFDLFSLLPAGMPLGCNKVYFPCNGAFTIVVPQQAQRCLFWNSLMLKVFVAFVCVTPASLHEGTLWYIFLAMVLLNVLLSCRTVFCDPGIVPAILRGEVDDGSGVQRPNPLLEAADPSYTEDMFSLMYCKACRHLRPKYSSHCKLCDICVSDFDHHCTVLGCCVGGRNVGSFISYLFCVSLSAAYGTTLLILSLSMLPEPLTLSSRTLYLYLLMGACGVGTTVAVGGFACYYSFLVLSGKSSKQYLTSSADASFGVRKLIISIVRPSRSLLGDYRVAMELQQRTQAAVVVVTNAPVEK